MRQEILQAISSHYGFDIKDVAEAFDMINSFDKLIKMCENTKKLGVGLKVVMKIINDYDN